MLSLKTIILISGMFLSLSEFSKGLKSQNSSNHATKQKQLEKIIAQDPLIDQDQDFNELQLIRNDVKRKQVSHHSLHQLKSDPCYFKRCYPGQKCQVNPKTGRASCVCKTHCKKVTKPLCGTDNNFYENHCEMYKESCTSMQNIYDARNKDCFYKRSECSSNEFEKFLVHFLEYHLSATNYLQHKVETQVKNLSKSKILKREKRSRPGRIHSHHKKASRIEFDSGEYDLVPPKSVSITHVAKPKVIALSSTISPQEIDISNHPTVSRLISTELVSETTTNQVDQDVILKDSERPKQAVFDTSYNDDVITSNERGDAVKALFRFMDLDINGLVGSEETYELVMLENLDTVMPPPCSVFHLLNFADKNEDNYLDLHEILAIYNVTILELENEDCEVNVVAHYREDVTFECGIKGEPSPVWRRHGYDLNVHSAKNVLVNDVFVKIKGIGPEHAGNYTCHARRRPEIFQVIMLSVHVGPHVEIYPRNQHVIEGNSATVFCHVKGVPQPSIKWLVNGEPVDTDSSKYVLMGNNSELHLNNVDVDDSAAYSCVANNGVDSSEEIAAIFVEDNKQIVSDFATTATASFVAFHISGIRIINPLSCQELRNIHSSDAVPGLLRQGKLCKLSEKEGKHECIWGMAVAVGSRFVYATQPNENRIVVVDIRLQRVVEILATDETPVTLQYVASSDQLFVFCHNSDQTSRSTIQVIYAASVPGAHSATQIQPLEGGMRVDLSIQAFYIPKEGILNFESKYGFVSHKNEQLIYKLNLSSLLYEPEMINLTPYSCTPTGFAYQPIGGRLDVTCQTSNGERTRTLTVEHTTNRVVDMNQDTGYDQEFVSEDSRHLVRVFPFDQLLKVYNVSASGDISESIVLHTNFRVADAIFVETLGNLEAATIYVSSKDQGDLMYMNAANGAVEVIDSLAPPIESGKLSSEIENRKMTASNWYDNYIAVAGITELEIINVVTNEISCRFDDLIETTAIAWIDELK